MAKNRVITEQELERQHNAWLKRQAELGKVHYKFQRTARKSHFCEICGTEIHKSENVWWYKPWPYRGRDGKVKYRKWRTRCTEHEPIRYNEEEFDEDVGEHSYRDNGFGRY